MDFNISQPLRLGFKVGDAARHHSFATARRLALAVSGNQKNSPLSQINVQLNYFGNFILAGKLVSLENQSFSDAVGVSLTEQEVIPLNRPQFIARAKRLACLTLAFLAVGCALKPVTNLEPTLTPAHDYVIGPGDSLQISVWHNPEASQSVTVRPDGKITTPLVEDMPAAGKSTSQLARDMEKSLSKYIQEPIVTVIASGFIGPYSEQIRVIGQAAKPQALPYRDNMTVLDVMITVGGITDFAAGNKTRIIRTLNGKQQQFIVRLDDLIKDGDISANVPMRPGDIMVIPESFF